MPWAPLDPKPWAPLQPHPHLALDLHAARWCEGVAGEQLTRGLADLDAAWEAGHRQGGVQQVRKVWAQRAWQGGVTYALVQRCKLSAEWPYLP